MIFVSLLSMQGLLNSSITSLKLMTWLDSGVAIGAGRLLSLLDLVGSLSSLSKSKKKYSSCCLLSMMILILSVSLKVSTTLTYDICPSYLCQNFICGFLLKRYVGQLLFLTCIILSRGKVSKTKRFFFFIADPIIILSCFTTIYSG